MIRLFAVVAALALPFAAKAEDAVTTFTLENGMEVVVIEDDPTGASADEVDVLLGIVGLNV